MSPNNHILISYHQKISYCKCRSQFRQIRKSIKFWRILFSIDWWFSWKLLFVILRVALQFFIISCDIWVISINIFSSQTSTTYAVFQLFLEDLPSSTPTLLRDITPASWVNTVEDRLFTNMSCACRSKSKKLSLVWEKACSTWLPFSNFGLPCSG